MQRLRFGDDLGVAAGTTGFEPGLALAAHTRVGFRSPAAQGCARFEHGKTCSASSHPLGAWSAFKPYHLTLRSVGRSPAPRHLAMPSPMKRWPARHDLEADQRFRAHAPDGLEVAGLRDVDDDRRDEGRDHPPRLISEMNAREMKGRGS